MKHFKQTYLILIISALIYSCTTQKQESIREPKPLNCLIDSIGKNDTLRINSTTIGCEHYVVEEVRIYRKSDNLFADLTITTHRINKIETFHPLAQFIRDSSLFAYAEFEKTGKTLKTGDGCTTRHEYIISLKDDSIKFKDNNCGYRGYYILKNKLFGENKIDSCNKKIFPYYIY